MATAKQLLTHSRKHAFQECRRKHWYLYELGLRRIDDAKALRIGTAIHAGIESLGNDGNLEAACGAVRKCYSMMPDTFDPYYWDIEQETCLRLVCGYQWRWGSSQLDIIAAEFTFQIPLTNPATGAETPVWDLAGKIDGIVRLEDGRLAVKETKTTSDDIKPDSDYWRRLRIDQQISLYIHAARQKGFNVQTVLYDVIRKPTIQPTPVALTDEMGIKIVLDADGNRVRNANKTWKQTSDIEKGYCLQTRPMTPDEWGQKLTADIAERPDYYFARNEIPRLDQDLDECRQEIWEIQQTIREAQRSNRWFRTVGRGCEFCPFFDPCSTNLKIDPARPPEGFEIITDVNPELKGSTNGNNSTTAPGGSAESTATPATACEPAVA